MTVIAGSNTFGFVISDAESSGPSGNIIYLCVEAAELPVSFLQKIKQLSGGSSYSTRDGKFDEFLNINEAYVFAVVKNNVTLEYNAIFEQVMKWHDAGDAPLYFWLYDFVNSDYYVLGYLSGTVYDYLKGYFKGFKPVIEGNFVKLTNIQIQRCTT